LASDLPIEVAGTRIEASVPLEVRPRRVGFKSENMRRQQK